MKHTTPLTALALACTLALAGCVGGTTEDTDGTTGTTSTAEASRTAAEVSAEHNDADVMFAQMMIPHHQQAVDMSRTLLDKDDIPDDVRGFAQKVVDAQGPEIAQLNTMLSGWGEEPMSESGGMDHGSMGHGSDSGMGGMMTAEDMQALEAAEGAEVARLYLEQMTTHHEGAVQMAQDEVTNGQNPQAVDMARRISTDQQAEITEMEALLQELPEQS